MEFFTISLLNGISYGLLLFMLSSGLTLIFSMMGVLNFAHASFYMLGAYFAYSVMQLVGFWPALIVAPLLVGARATAEREQNEADAELEAASGSTRDPRDAEVAVLPWADQAVQAGSRGG